MWYLQYPETVASLGCRIFSTLRLRNLTGEIEDWVAGHPALAGREGPAPPPQPEVGRQREVGEDNQGGVFRDPEQEAHRQAGSEEVREVRQGSSGQKREVSEQEAARTLAPKNLAQPRTGRAVEETPAEVSVKREEEENKSEQDPEEEHGVREISESPRPMRERRRRRSSRSRSRRRRSSQRRREKKSHSRSPVRARPSQASGLRLPTPPPVPPVSGEGPRRPKSPSQLPPRWIAAGHRNPALYDRRPSPFEGRNKGAKKRERQPIFKVI